MSTVSPSDPSLSLSSSFEQPMTPTDIEPVNVLRKSPFSKLRTETLNNIFSFLTFGETHFVRTLSSRFRSFMPLVTFLSQRRLPDPTVNDLPYKPTTVIPGVVYGETQFVFNVDLIKNLSIGYQKKNKNTKSLSLSHIKFGERVRKRADDIKLSFSPAVPKEIIEGQSNVEICTKQKLVLSWNPCSLFLWRILDDNRSSSELSMLYPRDTNTRISHVHLGDGEILVSHFDSTDYIGIYTRDERFGWTSFKFDDFDPHEAIAEVLGSDANQIFILTDANLKILNKVDRRIVFNVSLNDYPNYQIKYYPEYKWIVIHYSDNKKIAILNTLTRKIILNSDLITSPQLAVESMAIDIRTKTLFAIINKTEGEYKEENEREQNSISQLSCWKILKDTDEAGALSPKVDLPFSTEKGNSNEFQLLADYNARILLIWNVAKRELTFWSPEDNKKVASVNMLDWISSYADSALDKNAYFIHKSQIDHKRNFVSLCFLQQSDDTDEAACVIKWQVPSLS